MPRRQKSQNKRQRAKPRRRRKWRVSWLSIRLVLLQWGREEDLGEIIFYIYHIRKIYHFFLHRSTFHRIVETADIISNLAKNTKSSSAKIKKPVQTPMIDNGSNSTTKIQKFRASSYVATTVVPSRRQRKSLTLQTPPISLPLATQKQLLNDANSESELEQENTLKIPIRRTIRRKSLKLFREVASRKCEKMS